MAIKDRPWEALVARGGGPGRKGPVKLPRSLERYFDALEAAQRERAGFEPIPERPYTEEDRRDDLDDLEHTIPAYRESPGWQNGEGRALLDEWERETRERMERNHA